MTDMKPGADAPLATGVPGTPAPNAPISSPLTIAEKYVAAGFSVVPIKADGTKRPSVTWKPYQERRPTPEDLSRWWGNGQRLGFALVHGAVSGGSEVLDFDAPGAWEEFSQLCADHELSDVLASCVHIETPSGGRHVLYRSEIPVEGNQKLAMRRSQVEADGRTEAELKRDGARPDGRGGWYKVETKIETRGEGGYTLAPGSPPAVHPSGKTYRVAVGRLDALPTLTERERAALLAMARACNEYADEERMHQTGRNSGATSAPRVAADGGIGIKPGDDFNERGDPLPLLLREGWQEAGRRGDVVLLTRPGKSPREGISATLGGVKDAPNVFYCFTSNAPPFEMERGYKPFAVYGLLECGGDFAEAARRLGADGYGDQTPPNVRHALRTAREVTDAPPPTDADAPPVIAPAAPPPKFQLTDDGNGLRLVHRHGADLRYCYAQGRWYVWDGARWKRDDGDRIEGRAKETARALLREAADVADPNEQKTLAAHALKMQAYPRVQAMIAMARSEVPVGPDDFDRDRWLLNCPNGTLNLRTGDLRPHRRQDLISRLCGCEFIPDAPAPRWEAFLRQVLPDADVRAFVQRACGYALTGDVSEQCLFFLYGSGRNGKSTLLDALMGAMGDYAMQAAPALLEAKENSSGPNNDVAELQGKRLVATIEVEDGKRMAEGLVKQITGGDRIKARFMRQDYFEFLPTHKIFFAANHQPTIRGQDFAIWRRIKVIPFTVTIGDDEVDPTLPEKLRAELPGILAWAVRGCQEWQRGGLRVPPAVAAATDEYRSEQDVLRDFLSECCVLRPSLEVTAAGLYTAYCDWCEESGERALGKKQFGVRLREQGGVKPGTHIGPNAARGWIGIGLRSDRTPPSGRTGAVSDVSDKSDTVSPISNLYSNPHVDIGKFTSDLSETSEDELDEDQSWREGLVDPFAE